MYIKEIANFSDTIWVSNLTRMALKEAIIIFTLTGDWAMC